MKKKLFSFVALSIMSVCSWGQGLFSASEVKSVMKRVADWQIANPAKGAEHDDLSWTHATLYMGMIDWAELTEKEDGDIEGPFTIALAAAKTENETQRLAGREIYVSCRFHSCGTGIYRYVS